MYDKVSTEVTGKYRVEYRVVTVIRHMVAVVVVVFNNIYVEPFMLPNYSLWVVFKSINEDTLPCLMFA